jgi:hypothetical protein
MTGTQISNMDPSVTLPDGAVVPFVVPPTTPGFDPALNYIYDLGADLLTRVSYTALAAPTAAAQVGSTDGNVQADIDARPTTAALASSAGGAMVGTQQTGANTAVRTDLSKNNDIVSLTDFTGIDMSGATDSASGLADAIADGRTLLVPNGALKVDSNLVLSPSALVIEGNGKNSVIDFSGGGSLTIKSDPVAIPDLAENIVGGSDTAKFVSAHGLVEGDVFIVWNPTDYSFSSFDTYSRDGRMFRVLEVIDSTNVRFYGVSPRTFTAASVDCYKLVGGPVTLRNIHIVPDPSGNLPIAVNGHQGVVIDGITVESGSLSYGISISRCFDFDIRLAGATVLDTGTGTCYPLIIGNSQNGRIRGGSFYSMRHSISFGGGNQTAAPPCADVLVHGLNLYNLGSSSVGAGDIHATCENITYSDCIMQSGFTLGGLNPTIKGCTIYGVSPSAVADGRCIYGSEIVGGVVSIINCRLVTWGDGASFGAIHLDVSNRNRDTLIISRGNTLENRGSSTTIRAHFVALGSTAGSYRIDTQIEDFSYQSSAALARVLNLGGTADVSAISRHSAYGLRRGKPDRSKRFGQLCRADAPSTHRRLFDAYRGCRD